VNVSAAGEPTLTIAARGASRTLIVVGAGALALGLGLFITVRAGRSAANTAAMRSDFVSTVTHGLKTPVSVIRGIGETLIRGRVNTPDRLREYAHLLVQEGHRLTRLIDNLLAYARVTDQAAVYVFESQSPVEIIDEVLKGFSRLLAEAGFSVTVSAPTDLPTVRADRTSIVLALDNLVDNAMRYSGDSHSFAIEAASAGANVEFRIIDSGKGIPPDDLLRVQGRFARGRSTNGHGSGLGLAIASRVAKDHGGQLRITSVLGGGTTATLVIPAFGGPSRG
jgi:signal transduction histidine kinase